MNPDRLREIEELYHAAREDRAALEKADPELRREVESLLAQKVSLEGVLDRPAASLLEDSTVTTLAAGAQLGPYKIEARIGAGGMGEVYRATDTRLGRAVAIKTVREKFSDRFEREARAISALNHPHICTLYDVGPNYLVMELVEGETLAARLKKGALSIDLVLRYGAEIADALAAAHAKEIIHRDLKPGNIMVTKSGVKVLDFGLAKTNLDETLTASHVILGTPAYLAPEQSEGKEADARTDIYALGLVLREMATGSRDGRTSSLPSQLAHVIERCLSKEPEDRWQAARDLKAELEWTLLVPAQPEETAPRRSRLTWVVAGVLALALVLLATLLTRVTRPPAHHPLVRLDVDLGPDVSLGSSAGSDVIISPDGTRLVYVSHNRLFTRPLDQPQATELPGTEGASAPFFSPDGQWVAFFGGGKLKKVSVTAGSAITLCDAPIGLGGAWGPDAAIIATLNQAGGLSRIPAGGGAAAPLTELDRERGEVTHRWPQILPGGKAVLFTANSRMVSRFDDASIEVISLADRRRKTLLRGGTYGRYIPSGHLLYVNRGTLFAVPFDLGALEVRGAPMPVLNQVVYRTNDGSVGFDASQTGTVVFVSGRAGWVTIQWLESDGKTRALLSKPGDYGRPNVSPDGRRLALEVGDGSSSQDIWVYDLGRDAMTRMSFDGKVNQGPIWSPDGRYVVFGSQEGLSWTRADGAGNPQLLIRTKGDVFPWSFTPDGKQLAYQQLAPGTAFDLWTVPLENDGAGLRAGKPEVFLQTPSDERYPSFSPDGRWVAFTSNESGIFQVYVRAFPDKGGRWQVSSAGGGYPMWSRSGRELFFESLENRIMVANYTVQRDSFVPDKPRLWSGTALSNRVNSSRNVDLAPDGKRVVAVMPAEQGETQRSRNHVVFLENFFDELRRRAPANARHP